MRTFAAAAVVMVAGCAVGPDYAAPELKAPEGWSAGSAERGAEQWWTVFKDGSLETLVGRAASASPDLKIARARVREARAMAAMTGASLWPEAGAGGNVARRRDSENGQFPSDGEAYSMHRAGFDAGWEIDVFGGRRRATEAAQADAESAREEHRAALVSVIGETALTYMDLRGRQLERAVRELNLKSADKTLELTRERLKAGLASDLDVSRAEAQRGAAAAEIAPVDEAVRRAIHRLSVLVGTPPTTLMKELSEVAPVPAAPDSLFVGIPSDLLNRRPDVRAAERRLAAATARIGVAVAERYPKFSLTGSLGLESLHAGDLLTAASRAWSFGPSVSWRLFEGGRVDAEIEAAEARHEAAGAGYERAFLLALEEVENALVGVLKERERNKALAESEAAARRAVTQASELHLKGLSSFLDVLSAERTMYDAQALKASSDARVAARVVALYKALGGGWTGLD